MQIHELTAETVARALFPQLSEKDIAIMTAQEDFTAAVANIKGVCSSIATQLESIASKLHSHPATNNDAVLESAVGDLNTMASQLKTAGSDESSAETGSALDDGSAGAPPTPASPSSGVSSTDTSGSAPSGDAVTPAAPQLTDAVTGEVIGTPVDPSADPNAAPAPTDTTGASGAGSTSGASDASAPVSSDGSTAPSEAAPTDPAAPTSTQPQGS